MKYILLNKIYVLLYLFLMQLECKSQEQEKYINKLVGILEKLYTKLARDDASPTKRSAAYILRHNTAETVKQVCCLVNKD